MNFIDKENKKISTEKKLINKSVEIQKTKTENKKYTGGIKDENIIPGHTIKQNDLLEQCDETCKICNLDNFLCNTWKDALKEECKKPYFNVIKKTLHTKSTFYPPVDHIFRFSHYFNHHDTKIVILGQDPYHNEHQAMGLSFSVNKGVRTPPSLVNIYKEIKNCYPNFKIPNHGSLDTWANQGVLLLNDSLTVLKNQPSSHSKIGWEIFTQKIIQLVNEECSNVVFMLWGNFAKQKIKFLDKEKHLILTSAHPSPFSAKKFFGNNHFLIANEYLKKHGKTPIKW